MTQNLQPNLRRLVSSGRINFLLLLAFFVFGAFQLQAQVVINEIDADQTSTDTDEFIELYGTPNASLDGLVVVLFNGSDDASYLSVDLDGYTLDENGLIVIGTSTVANVDIAFEGADNQIQNGADAVAIYTGDAADWPNDTPVSMTGLIDAMVYGTSDGDDAELLSGLGETTQLDEDVNGLKDLQSISRVPNGSETFVVTSPTPGALNEEATNTITEVANISEVRAVATGEQVRLTGEAVLVAASAERNQKWIVDATGGVLIDDANGTITTQYNIGDGITGLEGTLSSFNDLVQFIPAEDPGAASSTGNEITPVPATLAEVNSGDLQGQLVKVSDVEFAAADGTLTFTTDGGDLNFGNYTLTQGEVSAIFRAEYGDFDYIDMVVPQGPQNIVALVSEYQGDAQLIARSQADIMPAEGDGGSAEEGTILTYEITASEDLSEEDLADNSIDFNSSDLELGSESDASTDPQRVGVRFRGINIPADAEIISAYIQFEVDENGKNEDPFNQTIFVEDVANASEFSSANGDLSGRATAATTVSWMLPDGSWDEVGQAGEAQRTANLKPLIETILMKEDWEKGNAMAFLFEGEGRRVAKSLSTGNPPYLVIEAVIPPSPPEVSKEIEDIVTRPGWAFSLNVANYFIDIDSELEFEVAGPRGEALPMGVSLNGSEISGSIAEPGYYTMKVTAKEKGVDEPRMAEQVFGVAVQPAANRFIQPLSTVKLGTFGEGAAEISTFDPTSQKLFVTNAEFDRIDIIDMSDPMNLTLASNIDITTYGAGVNSVAFKNGLLVAAIEAENKQDNGKVVAFDADGTMQWEVTVGALPDMIAFNEAGTKVIVANEGEPSDDYTNDPEGSISIITVANQNVVHLDFQSYNGKQSELEAMGVRIFGPNATVAQDLEPEYVTVKGDSAYVTLQENNAIAIVDLQNDVLKDIKGLGYKDHNVAGNRFDAEGADKIYISNWPVKGAYMPDAIASIEIGGETYLLTANEGDAREYIAEVDEATCNTLSGDYDAEDGECLVYTDETEIGDVTLDPTAFPEADMLNEYIGGLKISAPYSDTDNDGDFDVLYAYGARSFTIWKADGSQVFDSGDDFEQITAAANPEYFNSSDDEYDFKDRSDNKGPEPEAITVGKVGDKSYAFIALERQGGIMVYDITNPAAPMFIEYFNNRNFDVDIESDASGDHAPEGLVFIPSADSPNGQNLLVVSNEVSGSVTVYSVGDANTKNPFTLAIFHNNDGESALLADTVEIAGMPKAVGSVGQFKNTLDSLRGQAMTRGYESIMLSSGDNFLPGQTFNASNANGVYYDAIALDSIGYDALCIGNHDFDFGTSVLADFISSYQTTTPPYLTSNLGFEEVPEMKALVDAGRVAPSTVIERNGEKIGVVGLTTPEITIISSPGKTEVSEALVDSVQKAVNALIADDVNKIILISHLQGLEDDMEFVKEIENVDIIIAGGGDELLSNDPSVGEAFKLEPKDRYPIVAQDKNGEEVYIVTTPGNYRFIGNLLVDFDANGKVTQLYQTNPVLVQGKANQGLVDNVEKPIRDYIKDLVSNIIAESEVDLDLRKPSLRTGETNGGNLVADALLWQAKETYDQFGVGAPDVALQNGGGLRIERIIEKGAFNENLTYEICAFTNILSMVESISPAKFKELMEWGVAEAPISNGRFPQIAGFRMTYDQGLPAGDRILNITLMKDDDSEVKIIENGAVVDGAPNINMVTIDFLAKGGDGYPFGDDLGLTVMGNTYQQALLNYITAENGLDSMITTAQYPEGMNERMFVETSPLAPEREVFEVFNDNCPDMPEGWVEWNTGEDLINCGGDANSYIDFNGFGVGAGTSYLVTPRVALGSGDFILSFDYVNSFGGPAPEVLYSTDYLGYGDPTTATWTVLQEATDSIAVQPEGDDFAHVDVSLAEMDAATAFAFKYVSEGGSGGQSLRFRIDNVIVTEPQAEPLEMVTENFVDDEDVLEDWSVFNEELNLFSWFADDAYVDFNGFGVGAGATWLTSPIMASSANDYMMSMNMVKRYGGPEVLVLFSADYPGYGDPRFYDWEVMEDASESVNDIDLGNNDFVPTGRLPLHGLREDGVFAIRYESEGPNGGESLRFRIDSIAFTPNNLPKSIAELEDMELAKGGSVNIDLSTYFEDADNDLILVATDLRGDELPAGLSFSENTITGTVDHYGHYGIIAIAVEDGEFAEDEEPGTAYQYFNIVVKPEAPTMMEQIGTVSLGTFGEGAAEISAYDPDTKNLYVTNAELGRIDMVNILDPTNPRPDENGIAIDTYGAGVTSVAFKNGILVAAIEAETKTDNGKVVAFDASGTYLWDVTVGALPDMVTFNEDGSQVIVANEGEPSDDYSVDPEGSISIINVSDQAVTTVGFASLNGMKPALEAEGVRIFGPNATVAQDLEPEYITVVGDSAFVTLQENNAIAIVDINTGELKSVKGLGYKDHSVERNGIDAEGVDEIYISTWPVKGMYQPDAIASYTVNGERYLLTANEGDAREYIVETDEATCTTLGGDYDDGECLVYTDETEIGDEDLDETVFGEGLEDMYDFIGGLKISAPYSDTDNDGDFDEIYVYGTRSFSIWKDDGSQVYDSKDEFEQITASLNPEYFNSSDDEYDFKDRSDNKGPEPEAITVGMVGDKTYAFIGLERQGGVMMYDVTDPMAPVFVEYMNNRDFGVDIENPESGDHAPEGIVFVPAAESPINANLVIVSNEVSGTVTIYTVGGKGAEVTTELADISEKEGFKSMEVDLSASFTDPDGDALNFTAMSSDEAIVTVAVNGSTLTVTEVAVGSAEITVSATDANTAAVSDMFTFTVIPNNAPTVANAISDQSEDEGFGIMTIDISAVFEDVDGDDLTITVASADESVVTAAISGQTLTVTEVGVGSSEITLSASDALGAIVSDAFEFTVIDVVPLSAESQRLTVYPNPVSRSLFITSPANVKLVKAKFFALNGQLVMEASLSHKQALDLSNLQSGVYMLHLLDTSGVVTELKIVKQ